MGDSSFKLGRRFYGVGIAPNWTLRLVVGFDQVIYHRLFCLGLTLRHVEFFFAVTRIHNRRRNLIM